MHLTIRSTHLFAERRWSRDKGPHGPCILERGVAKSCV